MIDALFSGISGLNAFQNGLNTESNNLSNTNTVGYKADKISFADMMYQDGIGKGVKVQTVDKDFAQGTFKITGNNLDLAIDGKGFFILKGDSGENFYSRAGNFRIGNDGTLQNPDGYIVQGIMTDTNYNILSSDNNITKITNDYSKTITSKIININKTIATFNALSTNYDKSVQNDPLNLIGHGYKTKEAKLGDIALLKNSLNQALNEYSANPIEGTTPSNQIATTTLLPTIFTTDLDELSIVINGITVSQIYDLNPEKTLNQFADKISSVSGFSATIDNGLLTITNLNPGDNALIDSYVTLDSPNGNKKFVVNTTEANTGEGYAKVGAIENALKTSIERADAKYLRIYNSLDTTSQQTNDIQMMLDTLAISNDPFGQAEINNGIIYLKQGDNRFAIAKISTVLFKDEQSLQPKGNNLFSKTLDSGEPIFATTQNKVLGETLELSNSDLGKGLVNLMVYQRAFEASSKSITTSDEFLKTAIQLKR